MDNIPLSDTIYRFSENGPTLTDALETAVESGQLLQARFLIVAGNCVHDDTVGVEREFFRVLERCCAPPWTHMELDLLQLASSGSSCQSCAEAVLSAAASEYRLITIRSFYRSGYSPGWSDGFLKAILSGRPEPGKLLLFLTKKQLQVLQQIPAARPRALVLLQS